MNPYSRLIPRLNGAEIDQRFDYYLGLAEKGVAGFMIFGGELETVRHGIKKFQAASDRTIIIASDLEQGLGHQTKGDYDVTRSMHGHRRHRERDEGA